MNRPRGFFALELIGSLERVETLIARFTAVGLNVRRKQDLIHYAWPRASDSSGLAAGALGDITPPSQNNCE